MSDNSGQWVVRLQSDQVKGPYSTDAINKMIVNGAFSGSEEICAYPEGEWKLLTKQPEFYDALLESLENPVEVDNKRTQKMEAETVIRVPEPAKQEDIPIPKLQTPDDLKELLDQERKAEEVRQKAQKNMSLAKTTSATPVVYQPGLISDPPPNNIIEDRDKNLEIQLTDIKKLQQKEIRKLLPFILLAILLLSLAIYVLYPQDQDGRAGWVLITPQKNAEAISAQELKELKRNAIKAFQTGLLEKVLSAQKDMVQAVEGAPKDLESMGLLCIAYQQIWPYTKQSQNDLKSILTVTQMARTVNPISNYSDTCQTVFLLTKGQSKEARSLLEKALDNQVDEKFSLVPFLYLIKAEILEAENNFINSAAYYESASKLWPQWQTPHFGLARMYYKQGKFSEAREEYMTMYKANKESKAALFGLGLVEVKGSKDPDKAIQYFANGFEIKQKLPKNFLTEALLNYAQILMEKNENKKALEVAQEGYHESPSHRALKELVLSLGGDEKVENAQTEIMLIGAQFENAGDCLVAQAQYKAAFELDAKNALAAFKAARCLWKINQTRDAVTWLEKSIGADPNLLQAYVLKADYESQKYNFANAARTLQAASKRFQQSHEITKAQALLEFRKNNMVGAIQYGERAVKIYNADVELLTLLAQAHIYYYLNAPTVGKNAQTQKENSRDLALRYSGRAVDLEPAWPESQITLAKVMAATDGPVRGEVYLKQLIRTYPYTIEYRVALAEFYKANEKYSEAAKAYEEVVSIEPKNKKANFGLAETYRIQNQPELAQRYYNLTSVLDPSDVEPMFANAKLLIETASGNEVKAKIGQALAKLELVKRINPDFPKVSFLMAKCYLELDDYAKALEMVKDEKTRNPNIADSFILAAEIYYRKDQFKECAAEYSAAIKMRPSSAELYVKSAVCYRKGDAVEIAEDMLAIALQKESGYPEIYREQGYIFEKKGNTTQAILAFKKYVALSPNAADMSIISDKVKSLGGSLDD
ncbi:tetratricopeptide repeat protein [bacterium]|nr:tetratricopeptide repeat protein [bacterium]